jgi:amidase
MTGPEGEALTTTKIPRWQDVARRRGKEIKSGMPQEYLLPETSFTKNSINLPEKSGLLSQRELELTSLTATELLKLIHNETYTAVEVTTAFCKRAAIAHQAVSRSTKLVVHCLQYIDKLSCLGNV